MTRLLLTLLALLTGLAAQLSPAQAAVSARREVEVGSVQHTREAVHRATRIAASVLPASAERRIGRDGGYAARPYAVPRVSTVLQGIDRARE